MKESLMTIDEVCLLLKVRKSYIYRLTSMNKIPHYKIGGLRFKRSDVEKWVERNRIKNSKPPAFESLVG